MSDDHNGIKIVTKTPLYTVDWYIKWVSSIVLMVGMLLTANNFYPTNLYFDLVGISGWLVVGMLWHDRSIIVLNTCAIVILIPTIFRIHLT
jgi:hypothetical protein